MDINPILKERRELLMLVEDMLVSLRAIANHDLDTADDEEDAYYTCRTFAEDKAREHKDSLAKLRGVP